MQSYVGLDVDPVAHEKALAQINVILHDNSSSNMEAHILLNNFKDIKSVLADVDEKLLVSGVDGVLMDLGMSSMQVSFLYLLSFYVCLCVSYCNSYINLCEIFAPQNENLILFCLFVVSGLRNQRVLKMDFLLFI